MHWLSNWQLYGIYLYRQCYGVTFTAVWTGACLSSMVASILHALADSAAESSTKDWAQVLVLPPIQSTSATPLFKKSFLNVLLHCYKSNLFAILQKEMFCVLAERDLVPFQEGIQCGCPETGCSFIKRDFIMDLDNLARSHCAVKQVSFLFFTTLLHHILFRALIVLHK